MKIYTIHNIDMIHISEFTQFTNRSVTSVRYLIENGNVVRKLKSFRDRSRLMIPLTELYGYPFVRQGSAMGKREIYHYNNKGEEVICPICSYTQEMCNERKRADALECPKGDD